METPFLSVRGPNQDQLRHIGHREDGQWEWHPLIDFELWQILYCNQAIGAFYSAAACEYEVRKTWDVFLVNAALTQLNKALYATRRTSLTSHLKKDCKLERDIQASLGKLEVLDLS